MITRYLVLSLSLASLVASAELPDLPQLPGGVVVHIGGEDPVRWTEDLVQLRSADRIRVHGLTRDSKIVAETRKRLRAKGIYGDIAVDEWSGDKLPYADNLVNVLVMPDSGYRMPDTEVLRVLVPDGVAWMKRDGAWAKIVKPRSSDIDEWTHNAHGPDGNPVAHDQVVGPPGHLQWRAGPMWSRAHDTDSNVSAMVTAKGRLFSIVDEAPAGVIGQHALPDKWFLVARDAFNGTLLWKVPIADWGWRAWKHTWFKARAGSMPLNLARRLVSIGDDVYVTLGYRAPVSRIDAATGKVKRVYEGTDYTNEILFLENRLYLSMVREDGLRLLRIDAATGRVDWQTAKAYRGSEKHYLRWGERHGSVTPPKLDAAVNLATDGKRICFMDDADIVCLDAADGQELWRQPATGEAGSLWVGSLILQHGVVLHSSPSKLIALAAKDGKALWQQEKQPLGHLWFSWQDLFVIDGLAWTWSKDSERKEYTQGNKKSRSLYPRFVNGYDLQTGEVKKQVPLGHIFTAHHHHRCYPNRATDRYILASRRGTEFVDIHGGEHSVHNWVRGACHLGMLPANGLQYVPPHPCRCYIDEKLSGFTALAPVGGAVAKVPDGDGRLQRGSAYGGTSEKVSNEDWPAFRGDNLRSGRAVTEVPASLQKAWQVKPGSKVSPPIAAEGKVFVSLVDEHHVVALDARDGKEVWAAAAGGRIDSPPAYWKGRIYFGSADGRVYCVRASDGDLVWRFAAAPTERLIGSFSQLESAWPVHGSVVVQDGRVYFAAGHSSYIDGGIMVYALDAETGEIVHSNRLTDPGTDFSTGEAQFTYGTGPGILNDILQANEETLFLRGDAFGLDLQPVKTTALRIRPLGGFLDDSYFRRSHWTFGTGKDSGGHGRLIAHDDHTVYTLRMMDSIHALDPNNFFTPGKGGYTLLADRKGGLSCVKVANSNSLNPMKKPLTVEAWIKPASPNGVILGRGGANAGYALLLKDGRPSFQVRIKDVAHKVIATRKVADRWTQVAGVLTPKAKLQIWIDGELAGSATAPSLMPGSAGQPTEIGADLGTGAGDYESPNAFTGLIDEVRLYHRALSEQEIRERVQQNASKPIRDPALVLALSFEDAETRDTSGNGNHGVGSGVESMAGKIGRALRFVGEGGASWKIQIPIRGKAMVATEQKLFVAGPPDVLDEIDPLGAFEGRKGGRLWVFAAATGERLAEYNLESPPVFNGMAAAAKRLYVSTADGRVVCLAGKEN